MEKEEVLLMLREKLIAYCHNGSFSWHHNKVKAKELITLLEENISIDLVTRIEDLINKHLLNVENKNGTYAQILRVALFNLRSIPRIRAKKLEAMLGKIFS